MQKFHLYSITHFTVAMRTIKILHEDLVGIVGLFVFLSVSNITQQVIHGLQ